MFLPAFHLPPEQCEAGDDSRVGRSRRKTPARISVKRGSVCEVALRARNAPGISWALVSVADAKPVGNSAHSRWSHVDWATSTSVGNTLNLGSRLPVSSRPEQGKDAQVPALLAICAAEKAWKLNPL